LQATNIATELAAATANKGDNTPIAGDESKDIKATGEQLAR
jgi:hypothetical protein